MRTNSRFTLAIQLLMVINASKNTAITSEFFAEKLCCNPVMVRQLYGSLKKAKLIDVKTGVGTKLAKPADEITLYDVYMAVEGEKAKHIFKFIDKPNDEYFKQFLLPYLYSSADAMMNELSKVTIAQLNSDFYPWREAHPDI